MYKQQVWKSLSVFTIIATLLIGYTNCSQPAVTDEMITEELTSNLPTGLLEISPKEKTINWNTLQTFKASGGKAPYTFQLLTGAGTIDRISGAYTAPEFDVASVIRVQDSEGNVSQTVVYSVFSAKGSIKLAFSKTTINPNDAITLTASGGTAPYTYFMISGVGTILSKVYTSTAAGSGVIGVMDSKGARGTFPVSVIGTALNPKHYLYRYKQAGSGLFLIAKDGTRTDLNLLGKFYILTSAKTLNTVPLRRCYINNSKGRFYTTSTCGSYTDEGVLGYLYNYAAVGSVSLFLCHNPSKGTYTLDTKQATCNAEGFNTSRIGYLPVQ